MRSPVKVGLAQWSPWRSTVLDFANPEFGVEKYDGKSWIHGFGCFGGKKWWGSKIDENRGCRKCVFLCSPSFFQVANGTQPDVHNSVGLIGVG